jgi:hypothetical protein
MERGGMVKTAAGGVIGRLLKAHELTHDEFSDICEQALEIGTEAPVEYLSKAAQGVAARRGQPGIVAPPEWQQEAWMRDWLDNRFGWKAGERGPRPGEEGCRVDPAIQRRFGVTPFGDVRVIEEDAA